MRYMISEKQLSNLILKQGVVEDLEYSKASNAEPEEDKFMVGQEVDEQGSEASISTAGSSSSSDSGNDHSSSMGADEYPEYPETGKWESGIERGAANQIAMNSKWSDVVGSKLTRGHANPLK